MTAEFHVQPAKYKCVVVVIGVKKIFNFRRILNLSVCWSHYRYWPALQRVQPVSRLVNVPTQCAPAERNKAPQLIEPKRCL